MNGTLSGKPGSHKSLIEYARPSQYGIEHQLPPLSICRVSIIQVLSTLFGKAFLKGK
jgi:hypothetical protein